MATALTPQTDITSEIVTWLMENPRQQKMKLIKNQHYYFLFFIFFYFIKSETIDKFVNHFDGHFAYLKILDFSFKGKMNIDGITGQRFWLMTYVTVSL